MKIRLAIIVGSLLLVGMLLVNFVLIMFWQRDALQREIERDQVVLARVVDRIPAGTSALDAVSPDSFPFTDFYPHGETGLILLSTGNDHLAASIPSNSFTSPLASALTEVMHTADPVVHSSGTFLERISSRSRVLVSARPIVRQGRVIGAVGISRSLESMYQALWRVEKIVLVYILINLLILSVIGFFRMRKVVVQPIERLVRLADQYHDDETMLFAAESPGGEFGQLAASLNSMLVRIEQDRQSLEKTVADLETANRKLKTHQQEMIRTEKLASVGRMAAGLAHEIGNPLGVVQGYLGLLAGAAGQSEEHHDFIKRAEQELQRVNALIRQMLDFARVSKGEPETFSLHELLQAIVEMVQVQPVFAEIGLECRLGAERDMVYADRDRLHQVFVNCLLNSVDAVIAAGRAGDGRITLSTELCGPSSESGRADFLRIQISDNGIGIAGEQQAVIFDPFYTTKEPGKGTGLGLSVSLAIVESMGGRMEMESKEGQGSVLSVFLPITARQLAPDHDDDYSHIK